MSRKYTTTELKEAMGSMKDQAAKDRRLDWVEIFEQVIEKLNEIPS